VNNQIIVTLLASTIKIPDDFIKQQKKTTFPHFNSSFPVNA